ncbi:RDD family protein [Candidatus Gottesmanbacteria bacterium]|nr:RDD family protein [Candidatus Gottesmanbacteria bacterium]
MEASGNNANNQVLETQAVLQQKENKYVGFLGRIFVPLVDIVFIIICANIFRHIVFFLSLHVIFEKACPIFELSDKVFFDVFLFGTYAVYCFISYVFFGTTLGKYIFGYKIIVSSGSKPSVGRIALREFIGKIFITGSIVLAFFNIIKLFSYFQIFSGLTNIPVISITLLLLAIFIISLYCIPFFFTPEKQFLHDIISGTFIISVGSFKTRILKLFALFFIIPSLVIAFQYLVNMHYLTTIYNQEQNEKDLCYFGFKHPGISYDRELEPDFSLTKDLSALSDAYPKTIDILKKKLSAWDPDFVITSITTSNSSEYKFMVYSPQRKSVSQYNSHKSDFGYTVDTSGVDDYHTATYDSYYEGISREKRIPTADLKEVIDVCMENIWKKNELSLVSCDYSLSPTFSFGQEIYWNCRFQKNKDSINDYICLVDANSGKYKEWQRQNIFRFLNNL